MRLRVNMAENGLLQDDLAVQKHGRSTAGITPKRLKPGSRIWTKTALQFCLSFRMFTDWRMQDAGCSAGAFSSWPVPSCGVTVTAASGSFPIIF